MKTIDIEVEIAHFYKPNTNLVIPNVSWGFLRYEADLLIISKAGYLTEVEIKVSLSDLKRDLDKKHSHDDPKIKYLYFAIPEKLEKHIQYIPEKAGIYIVRSRKGYDGDNYKYVDCIRIAKENKLCKAIDIYDRYTLARLGALRIWGLKRKLIKRTNHETDTR